MSSFLRAWYVFLALGMLTFVTTAFVGTAPTTLSAAVALPHQIPYRLGVSLREALGAMVDRRDLRDANARLRTELDETRERLRSLELETDRLREILAIREAQSPGVVATAQVVGGSSGTAVERLVLGAGERDGVEPNMPVTVPAGLVGIVTEATGGRSVVRTILDPESRVGVTVRDRGGQGVAVGEVGGRVRVVRFVESDPVQVGDVVETSSYGGLFPRGIQVGVVTDVLPPDPNDLRRSFLVRPAADLSVLLEVALIVPQ
ncbi:MAG: rod shape-determining protein MreC [Trueperaceae bacterium]